jgi:hypothetical protein
MRKEYEAKNKRFMDEYMDENKKTQAEASDEITEPRAEASETFGDTDSHAKISASHLRLGVVSIALYNGDYAAMHKLKYCSPKSYSLPVNDLNHVLVQKK